MRALTRAEVREVDRRAVADYAIPSLLLMENAGAAIARSALAWLAAHNAPTGAPVAVVCGKGANGGDGLVVARHLAIAGHAPTVACCFDRAKADRATDAGVNLGIVERMRIPLEEARDGAALAAWLARANAHLVIDALLGTGLEGEVREPYRGLIGAVNQAARPVLAVDIPSGLDCDTGRPLGVAVKATWTVTLAAMKVGLAKPEAREWTGPVEVAGIGVPRELVE
jgi:NAD(P)H-hydrate epimerase